MAKEVFLKGWSFKYTQSPTSKLLSILFLFAYCFTNFVPSTNFPRVELYPPSFLLQIVHYYIDSIFIRSQNKNLWFLTTQSFKNGHLNCSVIGGIIPPFNYWQEFTPFMWFVVAETPQVYFQSLIESFRHTISVRMICCWHVEFCHPLFEKLLPEVTRKNLIYI